MSRTKAEVLRELEARLEATHPERALARILAPDEGMRGKDSLSLQKQYRRYLELYHRVKDVAEDDPIVAEVDAELDRM